MGDIESSKCDICKLENVMVSRKYYYYDIKCDCCNGKEGNHFEIIRYCSNCIPNPPQKISVYIQPINENQ